MTKTVAPHVASVVAIATAVLAAIHPGFHLPADTAKWATLILVTGASAIQVITAFFHSNNHAKAVIVKELAKEAAARLTKP